MGSRILNPGLHVYLLRPGVGQYDTRFVVPNPRVRLSSSILNVYTKATAIPQITDAFQSLNDIGWYGSSYLIAQMALLPTCGRFYAFYNIKWVYCLSLLIFELGSVISALAPNSMALIIGRAVSGVGAAGIVSGTTTILSYCVALKTQAKLSPIVLGMYSIWLCNWSFDRGFYNGQQGAYLAVRVLDQPP